ncbi:MAG: phosphatase PAP2 family protein, partial [Actinobacteria bacterium]|nr:phosphatase PAP2 family protein [Actinomycetota bacterium]
TVRVSLDGMVFGPARAVHSASRELVGGPAPAIGPDGEVYVLYWDYRDDVFDYHGFPGRYRGRFELVLAASQDGGRHFREHVVERSVVPSRPFLPYLPPLPALAVDPEQGTLYAAWEDGRSGSSDVLIRGSANGGRTWSPARILYGSPADERTPALAAGPAARVVSLAYQVDGNGRARTAVRVSEDGGETYTAPAALTPTPFDARLLPRVPGRRNQLDLGSRLGLASAAGAAFAAWTDTRAGSADTGKADILLASVPGDLPAAQRLARAPAAPQGKPPQLEKRLVGGCAAGPLVDSRRSAEAVVRSFLSALDRRQTRRAHSYLDRRWRLGRPPTKAPHPHDRFVADYGSVSCLRPGTVQALGGDRHWRLFDTYSAVRRREGEDQTLIGRFWAYSDTGRAPWSIMGFWTRELAAGADSVVTRWIEATLEGIVANKVSPPRAARALALVSVAMHEAAKRRQRGTRSAVDSAAAAVFADLFPGGPYLAAATPPAPGSAIGARVGRSLIATGRRDRSSAVWDRSLPVGAGLWRPTPPTFVTTPLEPLAGTWRTWNLRSGSQFRPPPPPKAGTSLHRRELREVYEVSRVLTGRERRIAARWADGPGTATPAGHWNRIAIRLVEQKRLSIRESARLVAALNTAQADAFIAAWDAKYAYWSERPVSAIRRELDPDWRPYLATPPFPGYVSGHSTTSGAASEVLAAFFPDQASALRAWAEEAAVSRLLAGIHFRSDNDHGLLLGRRVAQVALARFRGKGR